MGFLTVVYTGMQNASSGLTAVQLYNYRAVQNSPDYTENQTNNLSINGSLEHDFGWFKWTKGLKLKASYSLKYSARQIAGFICFGLFGFISESYTSKVPLEQVQAGARQLLTDLLQSKILV